MCEAIFRSQSETVELLQSQIREVKMLRCFPSTDCSDSGCVSVSSHTESAATVTIKLAQHITGCCEKHTLCTLIGWWAVTSAQQQELFRFWSSWAASGIKSHICHFAPLWLWPLVSMNKHAWFFTLKSKMSLPLVPSSLICILSPLLFPKAAAGIWKVVFLWFYTARRLFNKGNLSFLHEFTLVANRRCL